MEGTCCLCTIFLKKMSTLLDMLWVPLAWLQWAPAPPNNATVALLAGHWSLFFSLFTLAVHKTTSCRWRFSAVWRPAKGALYAIQYFCYPFMIHCWPIKIYEFKH